MVSLAPTIPFDYAAESTCPSNLQPSGLLGGGEDERAKGTATEEAFVAKPALRSRSMASCPGHRSNKASPGPGAWLGT